MIVMRTEAIRQSTAFLTGRRQMRPDATVPWRGDRQRSVERRRMAKIVVVPDELFGLETTRLDEGRGDLSCPNKLILFSR